MTYPLLVWLNERLDETERIARAAAKGETKRWKVIDREKSIYDGHVAKVGIGGGVVSWETGQKLRKAVAEHIVRHDPLAVLAVVEAHRAILFYHSGSHECSGPDDNCMWILDGEVCPTVRALAAAYRHADGWQESWGPT